MTTTFILSLGKRIFSTWFNIPPQLLPNMASQFILFWFCGGGYFYFLKKPNNISTQSHVHTGNDEHDERELLARPPAGGGSSSSKHADLYIINGSEASQVSSNGGGSRYSRRHSANYEPLPNNGIGRVRHTRLTEEEVDRQPTVTGGGGSHSGSVGGGPRRSSPDWMGSRERRQASKSAKVGTVDPRWILILLIS